MSLEPRYRRRKGEKACDSLPRPFVDRKALLEAFASAFSRQDLSQPKVLAFHGLGGIGKSRLKQELRDGLGRVEGAIWAEVDFSLPTLRMPETALFSLRRQLSERHGVGFPTFDIVYAHLWKLTRPDVAAKEENNPLFEAGSLAGKFLSSAGIPLVSFAADAVKTGSGPLKRWWTKRGREDLQELSRLEPAEVEDRLPAYFAEDLSEHLEDSAVRCVIFFDTHEALLGDLRSEEQRLLRDEWLRELVLQLPSVLFVMGGRERLAWEIVSSNKTFSAWAEIFGDPVAVAALVDRLVHHAEVIVLRGDSYRLRGKGKEMLRGEGGD